MTITDTEVIRVADFAPAMRVAPPLDIPPRVEDDKGQNDQPVTTDTAERTSVRLDNRHRPTADAPDVPPHVAARRILADDVTDEGFAHPY